jgi:beta-galactosidase
MGKMYPPVSEKLPRLLHGGDYNPEQWPQEVWDEDIRLMKLAHVNAATVGVFSWASLQPAPDRFEFAWLDKVLDKLAENDIFAVLATPTAAHPAWLSQGHPEVLRSDRTGRRRRHGGRVNFCPNSTVYRQACATIVRRLAERYKDHPAMLLWHVSNEYGGECYCENCATAFRAWLQQQHGSLESLNEDWYTPFWSHTFTDWSQVEPPYENGERSIPALCIDYQRFCSDSLLACFLNEAGVIRQVTPGVPVTTNMMGTHYSTDYGKWAPHVDVIAWDCYPSIRSDIAETAFQHDLMSGLKGGKPFLLMEQTPSSQNWQAVNALKRPKQMSLWSWMAVAHGSDSVMYFQWRRSRGGPEKLHGAVVDHVGHSETRVFQEVAQLGEQMERSGDAFVGAAAPAEIALVFDWENWWTLESTSGPVRAKQYQAAVFRHYRALWARNIPVHVVTTDCDLSEYALIIAPMLYAVRSDWAENITEFVRAGGRLVTTCLTGWVDEHDLAHLGGYPGPLREALGVWVEEIDALFEDQTNRIIIKRSFGPCRGEYTCRRLCEVVHAETATVLATYGGEFYAGWPAVTENALGEGYAYYIGTETEVDFLEHFYRTVCADCGIFPCLESQPGVEVRRRTQKDRVFTFVLNHNDELAYVELGQKRYRDLLTGRVHSGSVPLRGFDVRILEEEAARPAAVEGERTEGWEELL